MNLDQNSGFGLSVRSRPADSAAKCLREPAFLAPSPDPVKRQPTDPPFLFREFRRRPDAESNHYPSGIKDPARAAWFIQVVRSSQASSEWPLRYESATAE